jgi:hypothetical protein
MCKQGNVYYKMDVLDNRSTVLSVDIKRAQMDNKGGIKNNSNKL